MADYFRDASWFNVPLERQGEIVLESLYPRGRLLGGSASQGSGKVSKLAAIAAARRKKENMNPESSDSASSVALLDKLGSKRSQVHSSEPRATATALATPEHVGYKNPPRKYPVRERNASSEALRAEIDVADVSSVFDQGVITSKASVVMPVAHPSDFARTMLGYRCELGPNLSHDTSSFYSLLSPRRLSLHGPETLINAFAEPSPDDVVLKAQSSKGPPRISSGT